MTLEYQAVAESNESERKSDRPRVFTLVAIIAILGMAFFAGKYSASVSVQTIALDTGVTKAHKVNGMKSVRGRGGRTMSPTISADALMCSNPATTISCNAPEIDCCDRDVNSYCCCDDETSCQSMYGYSIDHSDCCDMWA
eukprot:CAMPEP_0182416330 /NCGR_PEP_ID=MMETSP1167-20130531/597_1 /TAXON_ID=2988 /ORGANISM="Mallomonas Sp, Strain CCMP3275" /LENGTH=139 /DNA_ID=CAMNT_0024588995 /DNA_START=93 /DNA_END=512 /DNA_ORIENTATION=+